MKNHKTSTGFVKQLLVKTPTSSAKQTPPVNLIKPSSHTPFETIFQKLFSRNGPNSNNTTQSKAVNKPQMQSNTREKPKCDTQQTKQTVLRRKTNYGIMKTNSFTIEINVSKVVISPSHKRKIIKVIENRLALFPKISRLNHSCQPNCNHYWCGQAGKFMIRAIR